MGGARDRHARPVDLHSQLLTGSDPAAHHAGRRCREERRRAAVRRLGAVAPGGNLRVHSRRGTSVSFRSRARDRQASGRGRTPVLGSRRAGVTRPPATPDQQSPMDTTEPGTSTAHTAVASFGQQRMWLIDRLLPGKPLYNEMRTERVRGPLDVAILQRALDAVVERHDLLRTRFAAVDSEPQQVIADEARIAIAIEDVTGATAAEREARARAAAEAEGAVLFDLERGPLLRARLPARLRRTSTGWSSPCTTSSPTAGRWGAARELSALYAAYVRGEPSPLPELPIQYADYAVWQRGWLAGRGARAAARVLEAARWPARRVLELPLDRPRPAVPDHRGERRALRRSTRAVAQALKALARREGATLFMTLLAAFDVLLHRYSGQDDIAVGMPIAGPQPARARGADRLLRQHAGAARATCAATRRFRELLGACARRRSTRYAHQDLPFEQLVEELAPGARPRAQPAVPGDVRAAEHAGGALRAAGPGASTRRSWLAAETRQVRPRRCRSWRAGGGLRGGVEFSADLFDAATIERMAGHFRDAARGRSSPIRSAGAPRCRCSTRAERAPARVELERHRRRLSRRALHPRSSSRRRWRARRMRVAIVCGDGALDLRRARRARQPARARAARARRRGPDVPGRRLPRARRRTWSSRMLGDPQGGRRLRAARPRAARASASRCCCDDAGVALVAHRSRAAAAAAGDGRRGALRAIATGGAAIARAGGDPPPSRRRPTTSPT